MTDRRSAERRIAGRPASPGYAAGALYVGPIGARAERTAGDPAAERAALQAAIEAAAEALRDLAQGAGVQAAGILELQVAFLEDEVLAEPAYAAIEQGVPAQQAWAAALDVEIAGYEASEDEYFRARAADLHDIRERVLGLLHGGGGAEPAGAVPAGAIWLAPDITPSRFLAFDWARGGAIALTGGSPTSHVAMLARARGVPMVVGLQATAGETGGLHLAPAVLDARSGELVVHPGAAARANFEQAARSYAESAGRAAAHLHAAACTADGTRIRVLLNVAEPADLETLDPSICDGIGLVRTEFLFERHGGQPDEATQVACYERILEWAAGRPVTFRTLDAGGDKPIPGLTIDGESNPFLGVRGLRLSLLRPGVFRRQLRALARAAASAPAGAEVKLMLPMVTLAAELTHARAILDDEIAGLAAAAIAHRRPALGIMVEVPAAALAIDTFDAEFLSIGSNDLVQYLAAAGRDNAAVAGLADPLQPAVLRVLAQVCRHAAASGIEASLCGDAAGDPRAVPALLHAGLRVLSVAAPAVAQVKAAIAAVDLGRAHD